MYIEQLRSHSHQEQEPRDHESGIEADNGSSGYERYEDNREKLNEYSEEPQSFYPNTRIRPPREPSFWPAVYYAPDSGNGDAKKKIAETGKDDFEVPLDEACEILGVTRAQLYRLHHEGRLHAQKKPVEVTVIRNCLFFSRRELAEYGESRWQRKDNDK